MRTFNVVHCSYYSNKIRYPITVVQISDLHCKEYGIGQKYLIDQILGINPHFIACTGDLFNRRKKIYCQHVFDLLDGLTPKYPVFITEGNHEASMDDIGEMYLTEAGKHNAHVLLDTCEDLLEIRVIGMKQRPDPEVLKSLMSSDRLNLVLSHRPECFSLYCDSGADLVLAGHAHGGQIRIGDVAIYAPQQGVFPKYTSGLYTKDHTSMYVSKGLGDTVLFPRINNPHELNVIHLKPSADAM